MKEARSIHGTMMLYNRETKHKQVPTAYQMFSFQMENDRNLRKGNYGNNVDVAPPVPSLDEVITSLGIGRWTIMHFVAASLGNEYHLNYFAKVHHYIFMSYAL